MGKKATDEEREKYTADMARYVDEMKVYKTQESPEYTQSVRQYKCYKELHKLVNLLKSKTKTDRVLNNISESLVILQSDIPTRRDGEKDETYQKRKDKIAVLNLVELVDGVNLQNPDSIEERMDSMLVNNELISLFIEKAELINQKIKFNDSSMIVVSTVAEMIITEILKCSIAKLTSFEVNKKSLKPEHVICDELKRSCLYPLISSLEHFKKVEERDQRNQHYKKDCEIYRLNKHIERYKQCLSSEQKRVFKAPEVKYPPFGQIETNAGYAMGVPIQTHSKKGPITKVKYNWYGIEYDFESQSDDARPFNGDIMKIVSHLRETGIDDVSPELLKSVQISAHMKNFLSKVVIDLYIKFAVKIRLLLEYANIKIVNYRTVLTAFKLLLSEYYKSYGGSIEWDDSHTHLFSIISEKITLLEEHTKQLKKNKL